MTSSHTLDHLRTEFFQGNSVTDGRDRAKWEKDGSLDARSRARKIAKKLIESAKKSHLSGKLDRDIRQGRWEKPRLMALGECVLGVVGVGDCGKAVARRAVSFGMRVLGNDIVKLPDDFVTATGLEVVSLEKLLATADFVSLHTDLNATSYHLIGKAQLELMKAAAHLINTSRGPVVEEPALIQALQQGLIAGAALDVFEEEPLPADSPLRVLDNCFLAPHTANSSPRAWDRVHENTVRNLLEGLHATGELNAPS